MKKLYFLVKKYSSYQNEYEKYVLRNKEKYFFDTSVANPILFDLLFTNCTLPYAQSSHDLYPFRWKPKIQLDILRADLELIVNIIPSSLNSTFGRLRCREEISPLLAACMNMFIPLHFIEYLVEKGADTEFQICVNGDYIDIIKDLEENVDRNRIEDIKSIFMKNKKKIIDTKDIFRKGRFVPVISGPLTSIIAAVENSLR